MQNQKSPSSCTFAEAKTASVRGGEQGRKAQEKCGFCDSAEGGEQTILEPDKCVLPRLELRASTCPGQESPDPSAPCCAPTAHLEHLHGCWLISPGQSGEEGPAALHCCSTAGCLSLAQSSCSPQGWPLLC